MWAGLLRIGTALLFCVTFAAADAAERPPYGHKDFYPSEDRPIGFRGNGNGAFPGAAPVTTWRDGDTEMVEMEVANWGDAGGNIRGTFRKQKMPVFT